MEACRDLIPPTAVIRSRLACNVQERRLLRSLLNLSIQASRVDAPRSCIDDAHPSPSETPHERIG